MEGEMRRTSTLRYFWEYIEPGTMQKIEPIQKKLFDLSNEYWVSFAADQYLYDKKYIFVPGSLNETNFTEIPFLKKKGVMIR